MAPSSQSSGNCRSGEFESHLTRGRGRRDSQYLSHVASLRRPRDLVCPCGGISDPSDSTPLVDARHPPMRLHAVGAGAQPSIGLGTGRVHPRAMVTLRNCLGAFGSRFRRNQSRHSSEEVAVGDPQAGSDTSDHTAAVPSHPIDQPARHGIRSLASLSRWSASSVALPAWLRVAQVGPTRAYSWHKTERWVRYPSRLGAVLRYNRSIRRCSIWNNRLLRI